MDKTSTKSASELDDQLAEFSVNKIDHVVTAWREINELVK